MANRAAILKQKFQDSIGLPFERVLPEAVIQTVLEQQGVNYRQTLYTPVVMVWAWMSQVLDGDKSLSSAVSRVIAWLTAAGVTIPSADTGAGAQSAQTLTLGSSGTLAEAKRSSLASGGQGGATVVWATGQGLRWHHSDNE